MVQGTILESSLICNDSNINVIWFFLNSDINHYYKRMFSVQIRNILFFNNQLITICQTEKPLNITSVP